MSAILFEPHHDDAVLFACFTLLRIHPTVVTVLGDARVQDELGVTVFERERETIEAMKVVEPSNWRTWNHKDTEPNEDAIVSDMLHLNAIMHPKEVWAPLVEKRGHEQHNLVGRAAIHAFGEKRCCFYSTYRMGPYERSREGVRVEYEPGWLFQKHAALACYRSQALTPSFKHFAEDLNEYAI